MSLYAGITKSLFKTENGDPLILKPGQLEIFEAIATRYPKRNLVITYTQYGKSMTVALGVLFRVSTFAEKWAIVAPSKEQARIIMNELIKHTFDSKYFLSQLDVEVGLERLKRERTRDRLTFRRGGEVFVLTAEARNKKKAGQALMGYGAPNLVLDESSLIDDEIYSKAVRMVGGSADNFIIELGNPFFRNHFHKSFHSNTHNKLVIDYEQGLRESEGLPYEQGKLSPEVIEQARVLPNFRVLYECKFPDEDALDADGFARLVTEEDMAKAMAKEKVMGGKPKLGVDIGRGGDFNAFVLRYPNYMRLLEKNKVRDTMSNVVKIEDYKEQYNLDDRDIFIDDIGIGGGVTDRCREKGIMLTAVTAGSKPRNDERFANVKAEAYWEWMLWIKQGGAIENNEDFRQLVEIKYKENSSRKILIEPKENLKARVGYSPDIAEAGMLTFAPQETVAEVDFM